MPEPQFRLPVVKTADDVDALEHLSESEKDLGKKNLSMIPPTDGWWILGSDPELQSFYQIWERELTGLLFPNFQATPFGPMNLITLQVARLLGSDYVVALLTANTATAIAHGDLGVAGYTKLGMLAYPDSSVWTAEERLTLKFTEASLRRNMTDELFAQCLATWGTQKTLRHLSWLGYINQMVLIAETLGMRYIPETMQPPSTDMTPDMISQIVANVAHTTDSVRQMWDNLAQFEHYRQ